MSQVDILAAGRWWLTLTLLGALATPLAFDLFKSVADRGYSATKILGVLLTSYVLWILGSLGFLENNMAGIVAAALLVAAVSAVSYRRASRRQALAQWLRNNVGQVLLTEILFAVFFFGWAWVRAQNPVIAATEKPMEFAFLNAVGRSPSFPPLDPWLSGFAISYYYFGYVMTSMLARLSAVSEPVAFNLAIAWLVAGTAAGAFGLVYNLVAGSGARRGAIVLGLLAAIALPVAGNLEVGLEVLHANNIGSAEFWQWLDIRDLNGPPAADGAPRYEGTGWWWWRSSRVIHEYDLAGQPEEGLEPIVEFPGFSFVLGDLHPHVLALPFALLSLLIAFAWWREFCQKSINAGDWKASGANGKAQLLIERASRPLWLCTVILLGGLSFLNTWDVLIHLVIVLGAFVLARWRADGWHRLLVKQTVYLASLLVLPAILLYLPFYLGFRSQAAAPYLLPMLMRPTRLPQFLIIFGMSLWSIAVLLLALGARQRLRHWRAGLASMLGLAAMLMAAALFFAWVAASIADFIGPAQNLASSLGLSLPERSASAVDPLWGLTVVARILPTLLGARVVYPGLTLLLAAMFGLVVMVWLEVVPAAPTAEVAGERTPAGRRDSPGEQATADDAVENGAGDNQRGRGAALQGQDDLPFVLLLVATGVLLTIGPEFLYLRDVFGFRLNTTFKFYYQAWILFGAAALFALGYLWQRAKGAAVLATFGYALALALSLLFPVLAVGSRAQEYRGMEAVQRRPPTLDGLAQLQAFNPDEHEAVMWLRNQADGRYTILEAVGGAYTQYGRISASTGLPTLLGWGGHELQWRGSGSSEPAAREADVERIYTDSSLQNVTQLLDDYGVGLIYVGELERSKYGARGLEKFEEELPVAFSNGSVTIYRWQPIANRAS